jgi:hypothetical protein
MPSSFSKYAAFSSGVIPFVLSKKDAKYDPGSKAYFSALLPAVGVRRVDALRSVEKRVAVERYTRAAMGENQTERTRSGRRKSSRIDVHRAREVVWEIVSRTDGVQHADRPARVADRLTHVVHVLG